VQARAASTAVSTAGSNCRSRVVQARLGHASIQMTADRYGHLFPRDDDGVELAAAERAFLRG
jgi:integrase